MSDKLRAAAQAAYKAMISAELSDGSRREWDAAVDGLRAALAEPAIKKSLTVRPWFALTEDEIWTLHDSYPNPVEFAQAIEAKLREKNT